MPDLRQRLLRHRPARWMIPGVGALGVLLVLTLMLAQGSAAHPAQSGEVVTLTFQVSITAGTVPDDAVFWVCPDAQPDGTGCEQMNGEGNGPYTYQLSAATGTTYRHIVIEWTHGRQPGSNGKDPLPQPPVQRICSYSSLTVTKSNSYTCLADFTILNATPSPPALTPSPAITPTANPTATAGNDTYSTLITGMQIVIGVGLVLLVILLIILFWQRMSLRR